MNSTTYTNKHSEPLTLEQLTNTIADLSERFSAPCLNRILHGHATGIRLMERLKKEGFMIFPRDDKAPSVNRWRGVDMYTDYSLPKDEIHFVDQYGQVMKIYNINVDLSITEQK